MAELDRVLTALLASGRAESAADVLEKANPPERSSWEVLDRMATLRLHLGEPARAPALWQRGMGEAPEPAVASARIGATHLAEEDFDAARLAYRRALESKPGLFEACFGLAVLEQDAGDATAAYELARKAVAAAPMIVRATPRAIAAAVERFAAKPAGGNGPADPESSRTSAVASRNDAAGTIRAARRRLRGRASARRRHGPAAWRGRPSSPRRAT